MAGMSFAEKAKLFSALAELEEQHGMESIVAAVNEMAGTAEEKTGFDALRDIDRKNIGGKEPGDQMELFPASAKRSRNSASNRRRDGENEDIIRKWFEKNYPNESGPEMLLKMYYVDRLTQREIGEKIGVNQRAISAALARIPNQQRAKMIAGWTK